MGSFMTFYKRIDDEHKVLFDCIRECSDDPSNAEKYAFCKTKLRMHFDYEEGEFCRVQGYDCYGHYLKHYNFQTKFQSAHLPIPKEITDEAKNWLAQHIKNTDFAYRGKLHLRRHYVVPEPYIWEASFSVGDKQPYTQMDDEHVGLFDIVGEVEADRNSQELWDKLQALYNEHFRTEEALFTTIRDNKHDIADHFDYEEKQFMECGEPCDADAHKLKHDNFFKTLTWVTNPVSTEYIDWAMNWLAQHIKNTDFKYRYKLKTRHTTPEPYVWNKEFEVSYPRLDQEHVNLFVAMYNVENDLTNQDKVDHLMKIMREHFYYEEAQFCDAHDLPCDYCKEHKKKHSDFSERFVRMYAPVDLGEIKWAQDWLAQHIKNTDFAYKGHLKHETPEPYIWDESFKVDYSRLDKEHDVLFANILAVSQHPDDAAKLQVLKDNMQLHFDFEEQRFCNVEHYNCVDHKAKHYKFWVLGN